MTKTIKFFLVMLAVSGFLAGCSSNDTASEAETEVDAAAAQAEADAAAAAAAAEEAARLEAERLANLAKVFYFEFDSSVLNDEARQALLVHAEILSASPTSIRLEGHADERGTREYNMALGERRANAVRDFLILQGVDAGLIETISYGEEQPAYPGSSESSWAQNRRVELK